jgi:hypothetical protein
MNFIAAHRSEPWFCYLPTNAPHDPLQISESYVAPFRNKGLSEETAKTYGMVANIEANTGRLLKMLREMDLERDTIMIYLTDNGPQRDRFNGGMRGRKGTVYQGGIRVPCFVRYPRLVKPGSKIDQAAAHIDLAPTLLDLCGIQRDSSKPPMDGRSLAPLLRGETANWTDRTLFTQWHRGDEPELFRDCAARTQQYKLVNGVQLFDLAADPAEQHDIAAQKPEIAAGLRRETEAWFKDVSATRGYAPPRIHIGAPQETETILTRQDWRGPKATWDGSGLGHWEVEVSRPGRYEFRFRLPSTPAAAAATLRCAGREVTAQLERGAMEIRFPGVELPKGPARVEALLDSNGRVTSPHYVDVRKQ